MKVAAGFANAREAEGAHRTICMPKPDLAPVPLRNDACDTALSTQADMTCANRDMTIGRSAPAWSIDMHDDYGQHAGRTDEFMSGLQRALDTAGTNPAIDYQDSHHILNAKIHRLNAAA